MNHNQRPSAKPPKFPIKSKSSKKDLSPILSPKLTSEGKPAKKSRNSPIISCICWTDSQKTAPSCPSRTKNLSSGIRTKKSIEFETCRNEVKPKDPKIGQKRAKSEQKVKKVQNKVENFGCKMKKKENLLEKRNGKNKTKLNILLKNQDKQSSNHFDRKKIRIVRKSKQKQKIEKVASRKKYEKIKNFGQKKISDSELIRIKSATKIQAFFRGYLTRKILHSISNYYKNLEIPSKSSLTSIEPSYVSPKSLEKSSNPLEFPSIPLEVPSKILALSSIHSYINMNESSTPIYYSNILNEDSISSEISKILKKKLEIDNMKKDDLKIIQELSQKFQYSSKVLRILSQVVERRYGKLNTFFDLWIFKLKESLKYCVKIKESNDSTVKETFSSIEKKKKKIFWVPGEKSELKNWCLKIDEVSCVRASRLCVDQSNEMIRDEFSGECLIVLDGNGENLNDVEPSHSSTKPQIIIEALHNTPTLTLEHSEALKDYSSISSYPSQDPINEISSLEKDLDLKPPSHTTKKRSIGMTIFERDSPSNPLLITTNSEKPYDISGENLVIDRVIFMLELEIYHDFLENNEEIFDDVNFNVKLTEDFLMKNIFMFIGEALRPRVLRASTVPCVQTDAESFLKIIDQVFINSLNESDYFKVRVEARLEKFEDFLRDFRNGFEIDGEIFRRVKGKKLDNYSEIHNKAVFAACEELILHFVYLMKSSMFDRLSGKVGKIKLCSLFISIRDKLSEINDIKAGNLPLGDTIRPNGELDEAKLIQKQKQSLNTLIFEEIHTQDPYWTIPYHHEERLIFDLEQIILSDLLSEIF